MGNLAIAFLTVFVICGLFWRLFNQDEDVESNQNTNRRANTNSNKHKKRHKFCKRN